MGQLLASQTARQPTSPTSPPYSPPAIAGRFGKPYNLQVCAAFGGLSKHQQFKDLRAGCEVRRRRGGAVVGWMEAGEEPSVETGDSSSSSSRYAAPAQLLSRCSC